MMVDGCSSNPILASVGVSQAILLTFCSGVLSLTFFLRCLPLCQEQEGRAGRSNGGREKGKSSGEREMPSS